MFLDEYQPILNYIREIWGADHTHHILSFSPRNFLVFRRPCTLQGAATRFTNCHRMIGQIFVCLQSMYLFVSISLIFFLGIMTKVWKKIELNKTVNWTKEPLSYRLPIGWLNMSNVKDYIDSKGQIISECPYEIIVSPKIPTKKFPRFLP